MKRVHVAAAVIRGEDGRILIARRADSQHQGGLWEFPGGKVESGEDVETALARELREELGIEVGASRPLIQVSHDYPDKQVLLDVREVTAFSGQPHGAEGQPLAWVSPRELPQYSFPEANTPIVAAARLPDRYLITPDGLETPQLLRGIQKAVADGIRLIQLRAPDMYDPQYRDVAVDAVGLCAGKAQLMLKGPLEWLGDHRDLHSFPTRRSSDLGAGAADGGGLRHPVARAADANASRRDANRLGRSATVDRWVRASGVSIGWRRS